MKNKIDDLRNHLFVTVERLLDKDDPLDIERAKAVADVGQVLINSAKVEVELMRLLGVETGSRFMPLGEGERRPGPCAIGGGRAGR